MQNRNRTSREAEKKNLVDAAAFYLRACFGTRRPVSAKEFAQYLDLARPYLSRRSVELLGIPLSDYLRQQQLAHAQLLLRTTPISVEEVGRASGFVHVWTFYRCFRATFGVTPDAYRRAEMAKADHAGRK